MKCFQLILLFFILISCQKKKYDVGYIHTPQGDIMIWLSDETPNHKASFIQLVNDNYWDSLTFNRVIPNFVAQGGCPDTPEGFNDPEYLLDPEFSPHLRHVYGAVGAGRDGNPEMRSARCQFYIVQNKEGLARLDDKYTIFGKVIKGMDVVDKIVNLERDSIDQPLTPVPLKMGMVRLTELQIEEFGGDMNLDYN